MRSSTHSHCLFYTEIYRYRDLTVWPSAHGGVDTITSIYVVCISSLLRGEDPTVGGNHQNRLNTDKLRRNMTLGTAPIFPRNELDGWTAVVVVHDFFSGAQM